MSVILKSASRPSELVALLAYKFFLPSKNVKRNQVILKHDRQKQKIYHLLNLTSRSFAAVIQELDDELRDPVRLALISRRCRIAVIQTPITRSQTKEEGKKTSFC